MTLSRFLREYVYISLGGNRNGKIVRHANLMATMLIGGLWHGASWNFVIWGGLHGMFLVSNHGWRSLRGSPTTSTGEGGLAGRMTSRTVTFLAVTVAWVFFRAADWSTAVRMLKGMAGFNGISLPRKFAGVFGDLGNLRFEGVGSFTDVGSIESGVFWLITLAFLAWLVPPTHRWMANARPVLQKIEKPARWQWRSSPASAVVAAMLSGVALYFMLSNSSEFLYFQF